MQLNPVGSAKSAMANNTTSCEVVPVDSRFIPIAALRAAIGTVSATACLVLVALIIYLKKYKHSLCQRLVLYLAVAAFFHSLSYPLTRVNYYSPRLLLSPYCNFGALFNLYSSWVEVLALTCLTVGSFINGVLKKHLPQRAEWAYISIPYVLPLLWCWIPLIDHSFGNGHAWCDIRTINPNCEPFYFGAVLRFLIWYIPLGAILICLFLFAVVVFFRVRREMKSKTTAMEEWERNDLKEIRYLLLYPIVYLSLNIFSFINRLDVAVQGDQAEIIWYYLHVLTSPLRGAVIAVVFAFDPDTLKRLTNPKMFYDREMVEEYGAENSDLTFSVHSRASFSKQNYQSNINSEH